jgi:hypothetical protein
MSDSNASESPIETAANVAGTSATEAFELLGNETRVAILLALWEAFDAFPEGTWDPTDGNAVPFSTLYDRVEYDTTANFSYHLEKLEGRFIRKTNDGYELLPAGHEIVRTIIGIAGTNEATFEPVEIGIPCPICGAVTAITYQNQRLYRVCTECDGYHMLSDDYPAGLLMSTLANPAGFRNRTPNEIFAATRTRIYHEYAQRITGICPVCSGQTETKLHICDVHDPRANEACPACGRNYNPAVRVYRLYALELDVGRRNQYAPSCCGRVLLGARCRTGIHQAGHR